MRRSKRKKRGTIKNKRRKNVLAKTKGYRHGRSTKEAQAKEAIAHAGTHAFAHRRDKKSDRRKSWQVDINASVRPLGISYSRFMNKLKKGKIGLDRKILSQIAIENPATFEKIFKQVS